MLLHARELLAVRSPLDAELIVSEILGAWWGRNADADGGDVEEIIGEALMDHSARKGTPAALALLAGVAYLGTPRQAALAERSALKLIDAGVARPAWAARVGMVESAECYVSRDVYGDQESVICTYTYGGGGGGGPGVPVAPQHPGGGRGARGSPPPGPPPPPPPPPAPPSTAFVAASI